MRQQQDECEDAAEGHAGERVAVDPSIARAIEAGVKAGACWHALRVAYRPEAPWQHLGAALHRQSSEALAQATAGCRAAAMVGFSRSAGMPSSRSI